jgi:hypothetical protein
MEILSEQASDLKDPPLTVPEVLAIVAPKLIYWETSAQAQAKLSENFLSTLKSKTNPLDDLAPCGVNASLTFSPAPSVPRF